MRKFIVISFLIVVLALALGTWKFGTWNPTQWFQKSETLERVEVVPVAVDTIAEKPAVVEPVVKKTLPSFQKRIRSFSMVEIYETMKGVQDEIRMVFGNYTESERIELSHIPALRNFAEGSIDELKVWAKNAHTIAKNAELTPETFMVNENGMFLVGVKDRGWSVHPSGSLLAVMDRDGRLTSASAAPASTTKQTSKKTSTRSSVSRSSRTTTARTAGNFQDVGGTLYDRTSASQSPKRGSMFPDIGSTLRSPSNAKTSPGNNSSVGAKSFGNEKKPTEKTNDLNDEYDEYDDY